VLAPELRFCHLLVRVCDGEWSADDLRLHKAIELSEPTWDEALYTLAREILDSNDQLQPLAHGCIFSDDRVAFICADIPTSNTALIAYLRSVGFEPELGPSW
jgi:hypothetical protein